MSKIASEYIVNTGSTYVILPTYSSTTISMGHLMRVSTGGTNDTSYAGPFSIALARPNETGTAIPIAHIDVVDWSSNIQWIIGSDNATAAATRRFTLFEFNKTSSLYTWKGFITVNFGPISTVHTMRGHRVLYQTYTDGTVQVSNFGVTGTSTLWTGSSINVGSRIGFGSTNPANITNWYNITGITNNTGLTITPNAGVSGSSTPYVIEDLQIAYVTTNATAANGGLFLVKGLRYEDFSVAGTTILTAGTDNQKAVYRFLDRTVLTNTAAAGIAIESFNAPGNGWLSQSCYVLDTAPRIYKYNLRARLGTGSTEYSGLTAQASSTLPILLSTGTQTLTGTLSQNNNGRVATLNHGPGNGISSLYYVTTTRIYRSALTNITNNSTTWQSDVMLEVPPGGTNTFAATAALSGIEILSSIDRLFISTTHVTGTRSYITQYRTDSGQIDHIVFGDTRQLDQSLADPSITPYPNTQASLFAGWSESGYFHIARQGTTSAVSQLYCVPVNADWTYASTTNQRLIFPKFDTTGAVKFYRAYVTTQQYVGGSNLGFAPEPIRLYARTSGIDDNSGSWTLLDSHFDLTGFAGADSIQIMAEFRCIGLFCIPNRIHTVSVIYEDNSTDSHYQPSVANSDISNKRFAWRFSTAFGSTVPTLRVRLYDAVSGGVLVNDNTETPTGTFEKSTDGGSNWSSYDIVDKSNETTYIRYTPLSLGDNIKVRALLTQF